MKLEYDDPLSNFAFNFNLRGYTAAAIQGMEGLPAYEMYGLQVSAWDTEQGGYSEQALDRR